MLESRLAFGCKDSALDSMIIDGMILLAGERCLGVNEEQFRRSTTLNIIENGHFCQ